MPPEEKQTLGRGGILGSRGFCYRRKIEIKPTQMTKTDTTDKKKALWKYGLIQLFQLLIRFFPIKELGKKSITMSIGAGIAEE